MDARPARRSWTAAAPVRPQSAWSLLGGSVASDAWSSPFVVGGGRRQPLACLRQIGLGKILDGRAPQIGGGEHQRFIAPPLVAHDCNPLDRVAVCEIETHIAP